MPKFECWTKDGTEMHISANGPADVSIVVGVPHAAENGCLIAEPAAADRIASALHVAAAQVRAARGEAAEAKYVIDDDSDECGGLRIMGPTFGDDQVNSTDWVLVDDVPRLIAELGAWLAAHPAEAK